MNVWPAIVIVPLRLWKVGFAMALKLTGPLPAPVAPAVTANQPTALLTAVHAHPPGAVTIVVPPPPPATTDWLMGLRLNVQLAAAWETVNVWEAIVSVPVRADVFGFGATEKPTDPPPLPLDPLVTVIQPSLLAPVQAHPACVVTLVDPVPPAATTDWLAGEIEYVHPAPACVTVKVWPPMLSVPVR